MVQQPVAKSISSIAYKSQWSILEVFASIVFATLFFLLWPTDLISDDGAIVLRYMDNFAKGYFYSYNPADGPVFGVSGFLHGILAGSLAYTHLFSPMGSLLASNYTGLVLVSLVSFRLLSHYTSDYRIILPLWLLLMLSSPNFIVSVKSGLETPLHIAIVLLCLLLFLNGSRKLMWFVFVLAIISKLDAIPIVLMLLVAYIVQNVHLWRSAVFVKELARNILIYAVLPGVAWISFGYLVFGNPFPLSAYAKLYYQARTSRGWFPFLEMMLSDANSRTLLIILALLVVIYILYWIILKHRLNMMVHLVFGLAFVSQLALYYVYNPPERHPWYYALPEFLVRLQIIVIVCVLLERLAHKRKVIVGYACCLLLALIAWRHVSGAVRNAVYAMSVVESERMAIGRWIKEHSSPGDILFAAHGHIAREAGLYTIDYSGLNSWIAVDYRLDLNKMVVDLQPDWIVIPGLLDREIQATEGYRLRKSFYNITMFGVPAWRVYQRIDGRESGVFCSMAQTDGK